MLEAVQNDPPVILLSLPLCRRSDLVSSPTVQLPNCTVREQYPNKAADIYFENLITILPYSKLLKDLVSST